MGKKVQCRDLGFDCDGVVEGNTEEEVLMKVAAHAKEAHGMNEVSEEVRNKVLSVMQ
ncbi:MAG: DUF1059 domain-containing protein [Candidatus Thorarchaeota archaeon]